MILKGLIKKGMYYDSVSLMRVSRELTESEGVIDASVVMGTQENKAILKMAGLLIPEFGQSSDTDLLVVVSAENESYANEATSKVDGILTALRNKKETNKDSTATNIQQALTLLPEANLALISIAGKYAAREAIKALKNGLHVMIFSDNVSIADELMLKTYARENGLLVMGPDCGTAIINGVPLAFANVVNKGNIGIIAASGTGLQEVSSLISNFGGGISQAIGTGGRDIKEAIGGIMFIEAIKALRDDPKTDVIVLISKPPHTSVTQLIINESKYCNKPIIAILLGGNSDLLADSGMQIADSLEDAAIKAIELSSKSNSQNLTNSSAQKKDEYIKRAAGIASKTSGKYIRGLFSGGTLCDEAQFILKKIVGDIYSNTPINTDYQLDNIWKSQKHTIIDLGDDAFTVGRPHPMIDFSLRNKRILEEASDRETAIILLDVVLGYGAHLNPTFELIPVFKKVKAIAPNIAIVCTVTGTDNDPQNRSFVISELEKAGAIVMPSNVAAAMFTGYIAKNLN